MDQRVYLRLENGEIFALEDGTASGTSYVVENGVLASTSDVTHNSSAPNTAYVVESTGQQKQTYTDGNVSVQEGYVEEPATLENIAVKNNGTENVVYIVQQELLYSPFRRRSRYSSRCASFYAPSIYDEPATLENIPVENNGTENVVYIVQQEGANTEEMQYAVVGETDSMGSTFAIQAVDSSNADAGDERPVEYTDVTSVQDMSGIETLSRVATQEFAGSIIQSDSEIGTSQSVKGRYSGKELLPSDTEGNSIENISLSFYCQHCGETFEELTNFRLHLKTEHDIADMEGGSDGENELTLLPTCQLCSQTFVNANDLEEHIKLHGGKFDAMSQVSANTVSDQGSKANKPLRKSNFKCRFCDNCFDNRGLMLDHVATEHPDKSLPEENKSSSFTKCPYCHKMYVLRGNNKAMINHIYSAHPGKSIEIVSTLADKDDLLEEKINCPFCDLSFCWQKSLIRHMKDQHSKILAETGDDIFAELGIQDSHSPSRRHRRSVNDGNQNAELNCPVCQKKLLWEKSLRRHMKVCHKETPLRNRQNKNERLVFCCPHCSLVSKYACAVRKHMERKHPEKVKGIDIAKFQIPTMQVDPAADINLKTVDKRPAEVRLNFCPVIFRCPFCMYASKQSSNLIRHLTSVKHGKIFSHEELRDIGITSFKVLQNNVDDEEEEQKLDGTSTKRLPKLRLRGKLLDIVMTKFEILKQRKLENKENGIDAGENEDDFINMDIDKIINVAEDESEESFNEDDDDENEEIERPKRKRRTEMVKDSQRAIEQSNEKSGDNDDISEKLDQTDNNKDKAHTDHTNHTEIVESQVTTEGNEEKDKYEVVGKSGQKKDTDSYTSGDEMDETNISFETGSDNEIDLYMETNTNICELSNSESSSKMEPKTRSRKPDTENNVIDKQEKGKVKTTRSRQEVKSNEERTIDIQSRRSSRIDKVKSVAERKFSLKSKSKQIEVKTTAENSSKTNTETKSLMCEACHKEFSNFAMFKEHLSSHVNVKVLFRCKVCESEISFLKDMKSHMRKEHILDYPESDIANVHTSVVKTNTKVVTTYDCPYCEMLFSQSVTLQQHITLDHPNNIETVCIKQEIGITSTPKVNETVVSAYNCQFCECFFHNINDIVKHMHVIHRDVDRSRENTNIDSAVRKSGRKRKVPKWLEETNSDFSPAKKIKAINIENDYQVFSSRNETPVSRNKGKVQSKLTGEINRVDVGKKSKSIAGTSIVKARKETVSDKKNKVDVQTKVAQKTGNASEEQSPSSSNKAHDVETESTPKLNKLFRKPESLKTPSEDKIECQNKCPHCDFVARRSSALTFHINLKHANEKMENSAKIKEYETSNPSKSPKKAKATGSAVFSRQNTGILNKGKQDNDKAEDPYVENDQKGKRGEQTREVGSEISAKMKRNDGVKLSRTKKIENLNEKIASEEIEDEIDDEDDYDIEFGDSDDDYKPDKDDYEDGDSDLDELDEEGDYVDEGYSVSVKLECPYCETGLFTSYSILESHVKKKHPRQADSFSIADVKTKVELDGTIKTTNLVHTCKYCKKRFSSRSHARAHVKNKHSKKLEEALEKEELVDENEEWYKCMFCNVLSDSKENVFLHIKRQHPIEKEVHVDEIEKYKFSDEEMLQNLFNCPHCETRSRWKQCILRHINSSHSDIRDESIEIVREKQVVKKKFQNKYQCVYCNWQYDRKNDVLTHIAETHSEQPSVSEDDILVVDIANTVENDFQCPYCDLKSKYKRCVIRHVSRAHKDMKGFTQSDVISLSTKKSRKAVSEGLVYMCPFCDFDSRWKHCIVRHIDINHSDVKNFNLDSIPSEYRKRTVASLDETAELENENNRDMDYFKCPYCDAVEETKKRVVEHTLRCHPKKPKINQIKVTKAVWDDIDITHKDVVYKCPACDSGSKYKKTVVFHVRKAHPELKKFHVELLEADFKRSEENTGNMYMCKLCNELFMSTRGVSVHCIQVHPEEAKIVIETVSVSEKLTNLFRCLYCEHSSGWRKAIIKHVEIHHPDVKNFQAKDVICDIVQQKELKGSGGYQCPYCDTVNHWKKSIIRHIRTVHPRERQDFEIHYNPSVSVKPGGRSSRKSSKQINCLRCGTSCRSMEKMRKHFLSKHPKLAKNYLNKENTAFAYDSFNGRSLDYVCVLCNAKYMWKKSLLVHVKNRHRDKYDVYQALDHVVDIVAGGADDTGPVGSDYISGTKQHFPKLPKTEKKETEVSKTRQCEKCKVVLKTQWAANVHKKLKHSKCSKKRFPCSKCSLSFQTRLLCLRHKVRNHRYQGPTATLHCTIAGCKFRCKFHKVLQNHYSISHNLKIPILGNTTFSTYGAEGSVRCEICLRTFSSADQLKQHVDLHKKRRPVRFQCGTCGQQFPTGSLRDSHIETHHFDKLEMCDICGNLFTKSNLKKHIKTHEVELSAYVACPYCDQCVTAKTLNRHVFNEHQDILDCQCDICLSRDTTSSLSGYNCSICKRSFCQKPMVYVHSKLHHADITKNKVFSCEACPQFFLSKRMKDAHCHEHHRKKALVQSPAASVSRSTNTYNTDPTTHVIHIGQDEGKQYLPKLSESSMNAVIKELLVFEKGAENPYKCLLCSRSFTKSKYIKLHIRRAHVRDEDQPYRCKVCGSGFVRLTEFRKHSRSHSDFRPYKCRYCEKAFKQQANLRDHLRVHTNSKEYECFICKTEFRQRGGLTSHVVFHDTLKPFKCMYCQKGYTTRGELSRHMQKYNKEQTELSEKSYPCHICEETFPHYPMLLKHIDSHNPEKPFQCIACKEKFSNYVSMYFHKVKEEHFLLEEIQEGAKDLQKRGRKFRAKKNSMKAVGPEIVYARNQPMTETIYISQPDTYTEGEASIKPVEVIIEEFGQDQVVRVQENEPEHEELLSIAKQLTELSGFAESEYYTTKKNVHQEEDEIIKDMLDADDDVLANLSKQNVANKVSVNERERNKTFGRMEQVDEQKDTEEEGYDYMPEIENDATTAELAADDEETSYMTETGGQIHITGKTIPTNMEELVSLVSQNTSAGNNEQVMAYQSEDGSVIYVCLPDDQTMKTEEVVTKEPTDLVEDNSETIVQEPEDTEFKMDCSETAEECYQKASEAVSDGNQVLINTITPTREEYLMETDAVNIMQIPIIEQQAGTEEIHQTENVDGHTGDADEDFNENEQISTSEVEPLETNVMPIVEFVRNDQGVPVTSEQHDFVANQMQNNDAEELQNQDYNIVEPSFGNSTLTIQPQDSLSDETVESHEDLIRRSQLARHLTGNIEPLQTSRTQTRLSAIEQGLPSFRNEGPLVSQNLTQSESVSQGIITIAAAGPVVGNSQTNIAQTQVTVNDSSNFEQESVIRPGDSFVEGEETLVEYQIDESRFIKEELLDTDYAEMREKDREVMFFSDNIYTYSQTEKKFICLHCGAKIGTFKNLKNHIRRHAPLSTRTHMCTYCPKRFVTKNELKRHLFTHTGERNYECKDCGKKFIQAGHLQEHRRLHTGHKPFQCSECTAAFITKSQLVLHWGRRHSNNEFQCNKCDKVCKTEIDLRRHKGLEHSGREIETRVVKEEGGDHVCDICGQSFQKKTALKRHLEKHNLENLDESEKVVERFACEECGMSFKSKYYVKDHIKKVHTQEKSEICELCGMGFETKSILRRHRESKHADEDGNRKWFCNICNKSLGSKYAYGYHMGAKH